MNKTDKFKGYILYTIFRTDNTLILMWFLYLLSIIADLLVVLLLSALTVVFSEDLIINFSGLAIVPTILVFIYNIAHVILRFNKHDKYPKVIFSVLPATLLADNDWRDRMRALAHGLQIVSNYGPKKYSSTFEYLLSNMFHTSIGDYTKKNEIIDNENKILWVRKLTTSPYLERVSVLLQLDTTDKRLAFVNRSEKDLEEFFKPFKEFEEYVYRIHNDNEFRLKELDKQGVFSVVNLEMTKKQMLQAEVDSLYEYGMTDLWTRDINE